MSISHQLPLVSRLTCRPDSPRWLVEKGRKDEARRVLHSLRSGSHSPSSISQELHAITADIDTLRPSSSFSSFISLTLTLFRSPALFSRLWRAFLLQFMAQMCGATAMKYYLPLLLEALGLNRRLALMAGAIEMTAKIGMTVVEMWVIDRFGRRVCLVGGSLVMGIAMMVSSTTFCFMNVIIDSEIGKWGASYGVSEQLQQNGRCYLHCLYLYLRHGLQSWSWTGCLGIQRRGKPYFVLDAGLIHLTHVRIDLPNVCPCTWPQLRGFRRLHRQHPRLADLARWPGETAQRDLLLLHGRQLCLCSGRSTPVCRAKVILTDGDHLDAVP